MLALAVRDARQSPSWDANRKVEVKREHLREVAEMSYDFKTYMIKL